MITKEEAANIFREYSIFEGLLDKGWNNFWPEEIPPYLIIFDGKEYFGTREEAVKLGLLRPLVVENREFPEFDKFIDDHKTPENIRYDYHLQIVYMIAEEMEKQGLSKKKLAKRMGVSKSFVKDIFKGRNDMTLKTLAMFDKALGLDILITRKEE